MNGIVRRVIPVRKVPCFDVRMTYGRRPHVHSHHIRANSSIFCVWEVVWWWLTGWMNWFYYDIHLKKIRVVHSDRTNVPINSYVWPSAGRTRCFSGLSCSNQQPRTVKLSVHSQSLQGEGQLCHNRVIESPQCCHDPGSSESPIHGVQRRLRVKRRHPDSQNPNL
jgi:hypothetical protein